ncbi:MAG: SpoIID/LytB domain-containing protein [Candidatus Wallbacteria bacterium]|nr:SpoIID/LytB domain-containing protein [Candidatus Wallbacteria bacterium]
MSGRAFALVVAVLSCAAGRASASEPVRVGLFALLTPVELTLSAAAGELRLTLPGGAGATNMRLSQHGLRVRAEGGSRLVVWGGTAGRRLADRLTLARGRFEAAVAGAPLRELEGALTVSAAGGVLRVVLELPAPALAVESALIEREPGAGGEAIKAQVVACLSFVLAGRGRHVAAGFDLCDTTHCQRFAGIVRSASARERAAADAVVGLYLELGGRPLPAFYTAECGGRLERPSDLWGPIPSIFQSRPDPGCVRREWTVAMAREDWQRALERAAGRRLAGPVRAAFEVKRSSEDTGGLASAFAASAGGRSIEAPFESVAREVRAATGRWAMRSRRLVLVDRAGQVRLTGNGRGHLAGMCQAGAARMATQGRGFREILAFYYPGAGLRHV